MIVAARLGPRGLPSRIDRVPAPGQTGEGEARKTTSCAPFSLSTVVNILRAAGLDPGPRRGEATWNEFLRRHAQTLWACDFFSKKIWTPTGLTEYFVLFFLHLGTRRVHLAGIGARPDRVWMAAQAHAVAKFFAGLPTPPTHLLRDHDDKFVPEFDAAFRAIGIDVKPVGPMAPNLNAHAERFVLSIKSECLDHFLVFGEDHLRHLISEYLAHYHEERPHQGMHNNPLTGQPPPTAAEGKILCQERAPGNYCRRVCGLPRERGKLIAGFRWSGEIDRQPY